MTEDRGLASEADTLIDDRSEEQWNRIWLPQFYVDASSYITPVFPKYELATAKAKKV